MRAGVRVMAWVVGAAVASAAGVGVGAMQPDAGAKKSAVAAASSQEPLIEKIAKEIIAASPLAAPGDSKARDEAGEKLAACEDLIRAAGTRALWGGYNPEQGYDPESYRLMDRSHEDWFQLTELNPVVWAKLYLSTFMFPGRYAIHREGKFTVLELDARFRSDMDAGEYPYPFWHSPNKWTAYVKAEKVLLVFEGERLVAGLRKSPDPLAVKQIRRPWDARWVWTDKEGKPQPRVSLYTYLFSKDNPHVADLDKSFRALETHFRAENCTICHQPDNRARVNDLLLLDFPNQALAMRKSLVGILEHNEMPPGSEQAGVHSGVRDPKVREEMLRLAREFEKKADEAFEWEAGHKASTSSVRPGSNTGK